MQAFKNFKIIITALMLLALSSVHVNSAEECFEKTSRAIFKFNMAVDDIILEPLAKGYNKLPSPIKTGTSNFTSNISTLLSIPNNLLQGNINQLGHSVGSFVINSTVGILGFLNPAERMGLKPHKEDVGQTLGSYGIGTGCYFVLPFLGQPLLATRRTYSRHFCRSFCSCYFKRKELLGASGSTIDYYSVKATGVVDLELIMMQILKV